MSLATFRYEGRIHYPETRSFSFPENMLKTVCYKSSPFIPSLHMTHIFVCYNQICLLLKNLNRHIQYGHHFKALGKTMRTIKAKWNPISSFVHHKQNQHLTVWGSHISRMKEVTYCGLPIRLTDFFVQFLPLVMLSDLIHCTHMLLYKKKNMLPLHHASV